MKKEITKAQKVIQLIIFYLLSFTWGALMSIIGGIVGLVLTITGHKPHIFHNRLYWEVGKDWGGLELGCFFLCSPGSSLSLKQHEAGHGIQNIILGPFFPFLVGILSAARYWLREMKTPKAKYIYTAILTLCGCLIGAAPILVACLVTACPSWVAIPGALIIAYFAGIATWFFKFEIPKYGIGDRDKDGKYVDYDAFWPEGWATNWGKKYFIEK